MSVREQFELYSRKWTAYIVGGAVAFTILVHVGHAFHLKLLETIPEETLTQVMAVASLMLMGLVLETLFAADKTFGDHAKETQSTLQGASKKLDAISQQIEAASGIASYSTKETFEALWESIRERHQSLTLVGELPLQWTQEVKWLVERDQRDPAGSRNREMSIYRSLNTKSAAEMIELIAIAADARANLIKLHHMYGFDWGSWVLGSTDGGPAEVLLNYSNARQSSLTGLHLTNRAAAAFVSAITPRFNDVYLQDTSYQSVRLASKEEVDLIVEEKVEYQRRIVEMNQHGVPFVGTDKICEMMAGVLDGSSKELDVTHLCINEGAIDRLSDDGFQRWLEVNYAARRRNVKIRRIFIVRKADMEKPKLVKVISDMQATGIEVFLCRLDGLKPRLQEDFSLYDGKHLVYMDRGRVYWSGVGPDEALARRTENPGLMNAYRETFNELLKLSTPAAVPPPAGGDQGTAARPKAALPSQS